MSPEEFWRNGRAGQRGRRDGSMTVRAADGTTKSFPSDEFAQQPF
jgi:hypothetical protein